MKFQIRGAEGFNRVYVPFITPRVVDIETQHPVSAIPWALLFYPSGARRSPWARWLSLEPLQASRFLWGKCLQSLLYSDWTLTSKMVGRRSESMASQSDEDASSLPSFPLAFFGLAANKGLWCRVCKQSTGIQELKVRFALRDGGTNVYKSVSIVDSYTNNI